MQEEFTLNENKIYDYLNDTHKEYLWGLRFLRFENTWAIINKKQLKNVRIALIDSGLDINHEDLRDVNIEDGYNFLDDNEDVQDSYGHGTAIAGVIAATSNNNLGVAGVASGTTIVPIKVINNKGVATPEDVEKAIQWAIEKDVDFINLSLGQRKQKIDTNINTFYNAENEILKMALEKNIIFVSSIGNNKRKQMDYPASMNGVIGVGAYGVYNRPFKIFVSKNNSETYNETIHAPGVAIFTTLLNNKYGYVSGSSIACAFVTGALALIKSIFPQITPKLIKDVLLETCNVVYDNEEKMNIINVDNILNRCNELFLNKSQSNNNKYELFY